MEDRETPQMRKYKEGQWIFVQVCTNYMFQQFPNWPSSAWNTVSEKQYTYYKYSH